VREVEELVSGHRPGALPCDAPDAVAKRHVLRFEVSAEVLATFREAMTKIPTLGNPSMTTRLCFCFRDRSSGRLDVLMIAVVPATTATVPIGARDARATRLPTPSARAAGAGDSEGEESSSTCPLKSRRWRGAMLRTFGKSEGLSRGQRSQSGSILTRVPMLTRVPTLMPGTTLTMLTGGTMLT
jgi:hypothetical protein